MKIEFTSHAKDKFIILRKHNFNISEEEVLQAIKKPDNIERGRKGRLIAQKVVDKEHLLRVVYEIKENKIIIVTFYPARRSRYEDKI